MITLLFAAIYKILPDRTLTWRNVMVGAVVTALLFTIGKTLIGWYVGGSTIATSYGAAGALLVVLLWVYYSAQIFLLGAEFTKAWSGLQGSPAALAAGARPSEETPRPGRPPRRRRPAKPEAGSAADHGTLAVAALGHARHRGHRSAARSPVRRPSTNHGPLLRSLPGIALCLAIVLVAGLLQAVEEQIFEHPYVEALVGAILLGTAIRVVWEPGDLWRPGIRCSAGTLRTMSPAVPIIVQLDGGD